MKYIIFSTYEDQYTENENRIRFQKYASTLRFNFKIVEGVYKGKKEKSLIAPYSELLKRTAFQIFNQESVLELTSHTKGIYKAKLLYNDNDGKTLRTEDIGFFREVSKEEALKEESYTKYDNNYYICTKTENRGVFNG